MLKRNTFGLKAESSKLFILLLTIAACLASALYFIFIRGIVEAHTATFISVAYLIGHISSKRAEGEAELTKSKAYTESIIQNLLDTLVMVDAEAKIQTVNPATCQLLGYEEEELIGQPVGVIFAEEEARRFFQFFREPEKAKALRPQDTIRNRELICKAKDGRLIPMLFNASVLTDEEGNVTGVVAGAKDITELRLVETSLRRERNFSQNIVATIPDSLLVLDNDLRIKSANRTFYETFQTEPEKAIGSSISDILRDEGGRLSAELTRLLGTGDTLENFELLYQSEVLGERIFSISARRMLVAEEELVVLRDITKRKRAERRIERLNIMLRAIRNVNQLITREKDRDRLIESACKLLIETRGYHRAWIAILDEFGGLVTLTGSSFEKGFSSVANNWRNGMVPICVQKALRYSDPVVNRVSSSSDCAGCPLSEEHPVRTTMKARLAHAGRVYGVLSASYFRDVEIDKEELSLFGDLASDLALALHSIELEEAQKRMQHEIEKRQEYLASVLQNSPDSIITLDTANRIVEWNPGAERLFGYSYDEVVGKDIDDVVTRPDTEEKAIFFTRQALLRKEIPTMEVVRYRKDGTPLNLIRASSAVVIGDEVHGRMIIYTDITQRKRADEALKESEEKYRSLVHNVKLGICRSTPDPLGRFLEVNPAMEEITGYSREELLRMNVIDLYVHPRERGVVLELTRSRGKSAREILWKRKDGTEIVVWDTKFAVKDDAGQVLYLDAIVEDITERKLRDRELQELYAIEQQERQELEKEARARGQFINVLAHEMRTPLTPVMICAGMLRDAFSSNPESTHFKLTSNILKSTQAMVSRLDELLDLARFSSGTFALDWQVLDTRDFLEMVAAKFQPVAEDKEQRLVLELPETLPAIEADPSRLEQVLMNLLSNASKFSPEGRTITLRAVIEDNKLVVAIEDQGIGISSEEQARLFEPYHRIERDRWAFPGLGLGLAISKQIVEAHGGRIWLTSELGQGSTFCFSLPVGSSQ
jgi:PAS domain S-box-containing protein